MNKKAGVYGRVSTTEQATDGYSIDAQIDKGRRYATLQEWDVVDEYRDAGISGARSMEERPEAARFVNDARTGLVDVLICTKLDRFSRSTKRALNDLDLLDDLGVEIVFVEDHLDTTIPMGRAMRDLMLTFATLERETIRDRNMEGRYQKASKGGGWATGRPPFGYLPGEDGLLVIKEDEAKAIREAYRLRVQGTSYRKIADRLNAEGFSPRTRLDGATGDPLPLSFTAGSISHYIKNTAYMGEPIVRLLSPRLGAPKEPFEFAAPALVSDEVWNNANRVTDSRAFNSVGQDNRKRTYGLSGRIWHEHADESQSTMFGRARKLPRKEGPDLELRQYRCSDSRSRANNRYANAHYQPLCDRFGIINGQQVPSVQADWIEAMTLRFILDNLADPEKLEELIAQADEVTHGADPAADADDLRIKIAKLDSRVGRWTEQYAEGLIDKSTRDQRLDKILEERTTLEMRLADLLARETSQQTARRTVEAVFGSFDVRQAGEFLAPEGAVRFGKMPPPRGTSAWWQELRLWATETIDGQLATGQFQPLPGWVVKEVKNLAARLDLHVVLTANDDPRRPSVRVYFAPAQFRAYGGPWSRSDGPERTNGSAYLLQGWRVRQRDGQKSTPAGHGWPSTKV